MGLCWQVNLQKGEVPSEIESVGENRSLLTNTRQEIWSLKLVGFDQNVIAINSLFW